MDKRDYYEFFDQLDALRRHMDCCNNCASRGYFPCSGLEEDLSKKWDRNGGTMSQSDVENYINRCGDAY